MLGASHVTCSVYGEACTEARRWIEETTEISFPCEDFRESLKDGMLLCKLVENLSGINIGQLNPIPRSLAWMDNLVIFLNICRYMGLKKSQLFRVSDLAAVRNQNMPVKVKQKEEDRRLRNVLITIFWLGRLAYSLEDYQGPLPELEAFETLINKNRPPEMVDQERNKFELDTLSGSGTWPKLKRSSRSQDSSVKEGSLEYFEHMRRQLIPRLTANVKEKAVMYDRIQQGASRDKRHSEERSRSFYIPKSEDGQLTGKTAKRAHSVGVLNRKRDHTPTNEYKVPLYTGSITRRTPAKVSQSNIPKEPPIHYSQEPVKTNRTEQSFQYDTKPIIKGKAPSSHSAVRGRSKNKKDSDYVSVRALITQWSGPDAKRDIQSQPIQQEKYKNRRSLPANFDASDILSERKELPHSKSVAEAVHYKSQRNYISTSDWSLDARSPSVRNRGLPDRKQDYVVENRTRRKSEPSTYSSREYGPALIERNRSSSMKNKDDSNNRDFKDKARESIIKKSETTQDMYAAIPYAQQQKPQKEKERDMKSKDHYSEHPVKSRKSFPLIQKAEVKHVANYVDQKFYQPKNGASVDRRKLESISKYATMPARRTKVSRDELIGGKNEREGEREKVTDVNWDKMNRKVDEKSEKAIKHIPKRSSSERGSSPHRRLPTYEEAIVPLQETDLVDAAKKSEIDNKDYVSVELLQQKRARNKGKPSTVTAKGHDYLTQKPTVNEYISKQHVTHASELVQPNLPSKDATRNYEVTPKRRYSQERSKDFPSVKQTAASTNKSMGTSEFDARKASSEKTPHQNESDVYVKDVNNNQLPVYDGKALKTLLTSPQQRSSKNYSTRKSFEKDNQSSITKVADPVSKITKPKKENQDILNEYEHLREEQKTILDADFKDRSRLTRMDPNVAQQFTSQGGVSFSNVVHEGELLQLVAAEEKYWKDKIERKDKVERKETSAKQKEIKKVGNEKQERVNEMLQEFKKHDQRGKIDYSEITDTLRAEEEFLAQEAEKLLKQRFQEKAAIKPTLTTRDPQFDGKEHYNDSTKPKSPVEETSPGLHSILKPSSRQKKPPSVTSSDDINLKPEADQAYHHNHPKRILHSRSPVYICSGCRLPVERDICLYVAELQSYWHEKCFRCSVCHSNLIQNEQTPKIRVMFSRIHCENCLSNKKTGGQSTMV